VQVLYAYDAWATDRLLATAEQLRPEQLLAPAEAGRGSIRDTLVHLLGTQRGWLKWWSGALSADEAYRLQANPADYPDLAAVRALHQAVQHELRAFLAQLDEAEVQRPMTHTLPDGTTLRMRLWQLMLHVANHGTQHRSEVAALLTAAGASPGDLDLLYYLWPDGEAHLG
jgi:uncharacterized damage-inducible protein DinB